MKTLGGLSFSFGEQKTTQRACVWIFFQNSGAFETGAAAAEIVSIPSIPAFCVLKAL